MTLDARPTPPAIGDATVVGGTRLLTREAVMQLLDPETCVDAIEAAFRARGEGRPIHTGILGLTAPNGSFHVKAATMELSRPYFAAKINANFPANRTHHRLPTIQGVLALFDATNGSVLALMDSIAITVLRTAATTAVAARYLAAPDASTVTVVGCGAQALPQLIALRTVRPFRRVFAVDVDPAAADRFAKAAAAALGVPVQATDLERAARASEIIVTCTTSRTAFLNERHVSAGTFVAAVGADNNDKQEIDVDLMASAAVVADSVDQCAAIGDLHHAIAAGTMRKDDVRAALSDVVVDPSCGRHNADEIVVFDSTGIGFQDVAAAAVVYERAMQENIGLAIQLS